MNVAPSACIALLDGFRLQLPGASVRDLGEGLPRGAQRLIAHLCLSTKPARAAVAGRLWPEVTEERALGSLRSALWRVHKLAPGLIDSSSGTLAIANGVRVDIRELEQWQRSIRDGGPPADELTVPDAGLRGELLPGWYDDWVLLERERLRQARMHALERVALRLIMAGRSGEALEAAYAAVCVEPLRESAQRVLVQVHLAEGNVSEAIRAYETFRRLLAAELGLAPSPQMADLVRGLRLRPLR